MCSASCIGRALGLDAHRTTVARYEYRARLGELAAFRFFHQSAYVELNSPSPPDSNGQGGVKVNHHHFSCDASNNKLHKKRKLHIMIFGTQVLLKPVYADSGADVLQSVKGRRGLCTIQSLENAKTLGKITDTPGPGMPLVAMFERQIESVLPKSKMWYNFTPTLLRGALKDGSRNGQSISPCIS